MGTREVYNYKLKKWIPYVSDPDKWYQHLLDVRDSYAELDRQGRYMVSNGRKYRENEILRKQNGNVKAGVQFGVTDSSGDGDG